LERARKGDAEEFVRVYAPLCYAVARRRGIDQERAEEVMQQSVLHLLQLLPGFQYDRSRGRFKGLVKKIVSNRVADALGRAWPGLPEEAAQTLEAGPHDSDDVFEREWMKAHLDAALDRVRQEVRPSTFQSFQLTMLLGYGVAEAARILGLSANQVSQNKRRVLERLRHHLEELQHEST
jgi:RNA polymerase sigma-70 factor (ECF subfamily)